MEVTVASPGVVICVLPPLAARVPPGAGGVHEGGDRLAGDTVCRQPALAGPVPGSTNRHPDRAGRGEQVSQGNQHACFPFSKVWQWEQ